MFHWFFPGKMKTRLRCSGWRETCLSKRSVPEPGLFTGDDFRDDVRISLCLDKRSLAVLFRAPRLSSDIRVERLLSERWYRIVNIARPALAKPILHGWSCASFSSRHVCLLV